MRRINAFFRESEIPEPGEYSLHLWGDSGNWSCTSETLELDVVKKAAAEKISQEKGQNIPPEQIVFFIPTGEMDEFGPKLFEVQTPNLLNNDKLIVSLKVPINIKLIKQVNPGQKDSATYVEEATVYVRERASIEDIQTAIDQQLHIDINKNIESAPILANEQKLKICNLQLKERNYKLVMQQEDYAYFTIISESIDHNIPVTLVFKDSPNSVQRRETVFIQETQTVEEVESAINDKIRSLGIERSDDHPLFQGDRKAKISTLALEKSNYNIEIAVPDREQEMEGDSQETTAQSTTDHEPKRADLLQCLNSNAVYGAYSGAVAGTALAIVISLASNMAIETATITLGAAMPVGFIAGLLIGGISGGRSR